MNFEQGLPCSEGGKGTNWIMINRLTKSAHFNFLQVGLSTKKWAALYGKHIYRIHGKLRDKQSERSIQMLEEVLRFCVLEFGRSWEDQMAFGEVFPTRGTISFDGAGN
ncbi:uncharacterized protein M6B38_166145 [Iris pallida]|uniref:LAGLIDADG homing endonuclease n=1 Tax=Iris pallida TaxID=29817 RepID=A0AAX6EXX5_IRIPA|nr:uncharacterized protein M6B38_166145 [Iris pallida]